MKLRAAHLFALAGFSFAQPLFDLLGRNPEFLAAHGAGRLDIVVFALALVLVPPAVLLTGSARLHLVFVGALVAIVALQVFRRLDAPDAVVLALAAAAGVAGAALYARAAPVRAFVTVLAAAPVLFLALFLFDSEATALVRDGEEPVRVARIAPAQTPVVLLVFDELPLNSLLDEHGRIDAVRFPHFAALARGADWFPNATTVHEGTLWAVPAILTGRVPRPRELPRFEDHPQNVFTLLGGRYRLETTEQSTTLCPPSLCRDAPSFASLVADSSVVYLHAVLPDGVARDLPPVTERWTNFLGGSDDEADRFSRFLASIAATKRPTLYYAHVLLPHSPWRYLPSGETYDLHPPAVLWGRDEVWTDDVGLVVQSRQRHLLQTAYVDTLLGRLVARLKETALYDRALVVVVADHGISFRPGGKRRPVTEANLEDIAFVPLLVKRPGRRGGRVLERHVQTIDVLPTIADVIGVRVPWPLDGRSAYGGARAAADVTVFKDAGDRVALPLAEAVRRRRAALARQVGLFGSGTPPSALFGIGRDRTLIGRPAPAGETVEPDFVQRTGGIVAVSGRVPAGAESVVLVEAGRVAGVAPVFDGRFWALANNAKNNAVITTRIIRSP